MLATSWWKERADSAMTPFCSKWPLLQRTQNSPKFLTSPIDLYLKLLSLLLDRSLIICSWYLSAYLYTQGPLVWVKHPATTLPLHHLTTSVPPPTTSYKDHHWNCVHLHTWRSHTAVTISLAHGDTCQLRTSRFASPLSTFPQSASELGRMVSDGTKEENTWIPEYLMPWQGKSVWPHTAMQLHGLKGRRAREAQREMCMYMWPETASPHPSSPFSLPTFSLQRPSQRNKR